MAFRSCRVQKNREFFEGELSHISTVIRDVCKYLVLQDHLPQIDQAGSRDPEEIIAQAKSKSQSSKLNELQLHTKLYCDINDAYAELSGSLDKISDSFCGPNCRISMTAPKTNSGEPKDTIFEMVLMGNVMPSDGLLRLRGFRSMENR
jgi:hypothetical protein